jgi:L-lactate dehydrogenase complex protein LldG
MTREIVLNAIRRGLRRGPLPPDQAAMLRARLASHPRQIQPDIARGDRQALLLRFIANVEREFGTVALLPHADAVPGAIADYLAAQNLPTELVMSPHPELRAIPWSSRPLLAVREGQAQATDQVGLQHAFAAVAETGTLMLPSGADRATTVNLLPDTALVLLRTSRLVGGFEDAWDMLRTERQGTMPLMPRNVMLVTGPSRSADIEQTLELGAHGPRRLHVLLVEDAASAAV